MRNLIFSVESYNNYRHCESVYIVFDIQIKLQGG